VAAEACSTAVLIEVNVAELRGVVSAKIPSPASKNVFSVAVQPAGNVFDVKLLENS
jgi:hypothetical protein